MRARTKKKVVYFYNIQPTKEFISYHQPDKGILFSMRYLIKGMATITTITLI